MKDKIITTAAAVALVAICWAGTVSAQGFSSIMGKLDELEARLNSLEATQKRDIGNLQNQVSQVQPGQDWSELESSVATLGSRLDGLEVAWGGAGEAGNPEAVVGLTGDLRGLISELRDVVSGTPGQETTSGIGISGLDISGFVDASYFYDDNSGDNTFGFDQAEVDVEKSIGEIGSVRADVEWVSDGAGGFDLDAEQGYVTFKPSIHNPINFTFGKFNAPIGFELLDAPDMFQFSHALVFNYGLPTNLTGAMISTELGPSFDLSVYLCNGWDQNVDLNTGKTIGGRLGYAYEDIFAGGLSAIHGADAVAEGDFLTVIDVDAALTPLEGWTFGGEFNSGANVIGDSTYKWWGLLAMAHYDFTDWAGFTFRFDYFDDQDASRLGSGVAEKRQAVTLAPTFSLGDGMGALIEFRADFSDEEVFTDSNDEPTKSASGVAFEMTYTF